MNRKSFIQRVFLAPLALWLAPWKALAEDKAEVFAKIVEQKGRVWIAGRPAKVNAKARLGDEIKTGPDSSVTLKLKDESALLLRADTTIILRKQPDLGVVQMLLGRMLAMFGNGEHEVMTPTAVAGVRGTAMYTMLEDGGQVYFCVCRGTVDFSAKDDAAVKEEVVSEYHRAIRFVTRDGKPVIVDAPSKLDHSDEELNHLTELVRKPYYPWGQGGKGEPKFNYSHP